MNNEIKHIVSLGYFCGIAQDLEKMGLRECSLPFDWLLTNRFEDVLKLIDNRFFDFMELHKLRQSRNDPSHYSDGNYDIKYFHEFSRYKSPSWNYDQIKNKYKRRIEKFYKIISEPTLFIRYINPEITNEEGYSEEFLFVKANYDFIVNLLKSFNEKNEVIFIYNDRKLDDCVADNGFINFVRVTPDLGDVVCRSPLFNNFELKNYLDNVLLDIREKNLDFYKTNNHKKTLLTKSINKIKKCVLKPYSHPNKY